MSGTEIQSCTNYKGPGSWFGDSSYHRWFCHDCQRYGPAEIDGAICTSQLTQHGRTTEHLESINRGQ